MVKLREGQENIVALFVVVFYIKTVEESGYFLPIADYSCRVCYWKIQLQIMTDYISLPT